ESEWRRSREEGSGECGARSDCSQGRSDRKKVNGVIAGLPSRRLLPLPSRAVQTHRPARHDSWDRNRNMTNEAHFQERNMKHRRSIFHAVLYCLALIELLGPAAALAQHADLSAMDDVIDYVPKAKILGGKLAFQALLPVTNSSFTPSEVRFNPDGTGYVDTWVQRLTLEWDWSRANSWVAYALTAPTGRYAAGVANNIGSGYWSNSIASGTTVYLMKNNGITANLTTDWEI